MRALPAAHAATRRFPPHQALPAGAPTAPPVVVVGKKLPKRFALSASMAMNTLPTALPVVGAPT